MPRWQFFSNCLTKKDITPGPFAAAGAGRQTGEIEEALLDTNVVPHFCSHQIPSNLSSIQFNTHLHLFHSCTLRLRDHFYDMCVRDQLRFTMNTMHWMSQSALLCCHQSVMSISQMDETPLWHLPSTFVHSEKQKEKSSIARHVDEVAPDTKAERGTIMKHRAIKGVPDRLSWVWWASVSLRSSRAPQLINHQGGAWGARSLKPSITRLGGRQSPTHFHVLLFPPRAPVFDSQIKVQRWPGNHWMEAKVAGGCNQNEVWGKEKERKECKKFWYCKAF